MKTIGTVINTIVVVFGMLCSLIAGAFVGYSMAKDEKTNYPSRRAYTSYTNAGYYNGGYHEGWNDCRNLYRTTGRYPFKEDWKESEHNEDSGEA